jgi:hypothetical protein
MRKHGEVEGGGLLGFLREYSLDYIAVFEESYIRRPEKLKPMVVGAYMFPARRVWVGARW